METKYLKKYAPEARREFITAVKNKAAVYGLLPKQILSMKEEGDVVIIGDRPFPRSVAKQRKELEDRIKRDGFQQFIDAIAYTWFNRFVAIRYMELHGYLDHGYRVISHPEGKSTPEILENAERIELPGLNRDAVVDLKLDGGKDEQLYQMLLLAQCNALHKAMPFLFESIKDGTELLLPDNLLHTDSLVRTLVNDIPEEQWENVEIIGWLYQFYISEKKDEVIGKVVKSEDIPAATQLFTPNWIVKYLVQNSLGRQWIATYPDSPLKQQMEFYIEPAEQTPEVQQQLDEITPDSLNPEELTLLDPACGSGHILVEAYDLFKAIYTERGYRARDIPKLILEQNLFGLEIDDRAAQLAAFSLMMKARADDRIVFERSVKPQVLSIKNSRVLDVDEITDALNNSLPDGSVAMLERESIEYFLKLFEHGGTVGSLIGIPEPMVNELRNLSARTEAVMALGGLLERAAIEPLCSLLTQAFVLSRKFDCVVANPPYMGKRYLNSSIKEFAELHFSNAKTDLFAMFIERGFQLIKPVGVNAMVTMHNWMFLSSYKEMREHLLASKSINSLVHLGSGAFDEISGEVVQVAAFSMLGSHLKGYRPRFYRLVTGDSEKKMANLLNKQYEFETVTQDQLCGIPGTPVAYWISPTLFEVYKRGRLLGDVAVPSNGIQTGDNNRFVRNWVEVSQEQVGTRWIPYAKGGRCRKWYGNHEHYVDWLHDGHGIKQQSNCCVRGEEYYFMEGLTWSDITTGSLSSRLLPKGFLFDASGPSAFCQSEDERLAIIALMNSSLCRDLAQLLNPTLHFQAGDFKKLPFTSKLVNPNLVADARAAIRLAKDDWDTNELSWDFLRLPFITGHETLGKDYQEFKERCEKRRSEMRTLENAINNQICSLLETERGEDDDDVIVYSPDRIEDVKRLVSYSIGCMMGRYCLDEPGLVYARSGSIGFEPSKYLTFPADDDGIIPITDTLWFPDDAANRFEAFIKTAWPKEHLEENLTFVAESLDKKKSETSRDCIRRYFATGFYKHHLSMYKKRPIYWLFSSGTQRAFQCLVYLHRYNAGTLARMRVEYVVPLQGKMNARIEQLESDIPTASSTSHRKKLEKERDSLIKLREELQTFDEKLRHYADLRIELDLDDGVKVNYGKFGDLLAEAKTVSGSV
jgi:hypothetical protein